MKCMDKNVLMKVYLLKTIYANTIMATLRQYKMSPVLYTERSRSKPMTVESSISVSFNQGLLQIRYVLQLRMHSPMLFNS